MPPKDKKTRLDSYLVEEGLVPTRSKAQALIMSGAVTVDGERVDKPGAVVKEGSEVELKDSSQKFVGRGGQKLEGALTEFGIDVSGMVAVDVGASTGGFTDCLLQRGASKVYAVDVGYGQLDWKLRNDERVIVKEKINARYLKPEDIGEKTDIAVIDVSFISLTMVISPLIEILKPGARLVALIKPQFEVGKGQVGKGGIVKDESKHQEVVQKIKSFLENTGFTVQGVTPSPILGTEGNKEFLISAKVSSPLTGED